MIVSCTKCQKRFDRGFTNQNSICPSCGTDIDRVKAPQEVKELLHEPRGLRTSMAIVRNGEERMIVSCTKCQKRFDRGYTNQNSICPSYGTDIDHHTETSHTNSSRSYIGTGEISGPIHQKTEVDSLMERLTAWKLNESASLRKLVRDAIDTITLLTQEKVVTSQEVGELLHELKGLRTSMAIVRNGEDDAIGLLCGRISEALIPQVSIPKDFEVIIRELRALEVDVVLPGTGRNTCKHAADALIQLSREK